MAKIGFFSGSLAFTARYLIQTSLALDKWQTAEPERCYFCDSCLTVFMAFISLPFMAKVNPVT